MLITAAKLRRNLPGKSLVSAVNSQQLKRCTGSDAAVSRIERGASFCFSRFRSVWSDLLPGAENTVSRIPQTGADIGVFVEAAIYMSHIDLDVRMDFVKTF